LEQVVSLDKQRITPEERTKAYKEYSFDIFVNF